MERPETATDDLELRLDRLRRTMLRRCAESGGVPAATLTRLTAVLPGSPGARRLPAEPAARPAGSVR